MQIGKFHRSQVFRRMLSTVGFIKSGQSTAILFRYTGPCGRSPRGCRCPAPGFLGFDYLGRARYASLAFRSARLFGALSVITLHAERKLSRNALNANRLLSSVAAKMMQSMSMAKLSTKPHRWRRLPSRASSANLSRQIFRGILNPLIVNIRYSCRNFS